MDNVLYQRITCPYCRKVLRYMEQAGIQLPMRDTTDPEVLEELITLGGKAQVPCLMINGKALYESDDIIAYLQEHLADQ